MKTGLFVAMLIALALAFTCTIAKAETPGEFLEVDRLVQKYGVVKSEGTKGVEVVFTDPGTKEEYVLIGMNVSGRIGVAEGKKVVENGEILMANCTLIFYDPESDACYEMNFDLGWTIEISTEEAEDKVRYWLAKFYIVEGTFK